MTDSGVTVHADEDTIQDTSSAPVLEVSSTKFNDDDFEDNESDDDSDDSGIESSKSSQSRP
jgi:hypothetical protein